MITFCSNYLTEGAPSLKARWLLLDFFGMRALGNYMVLLKVSLTKELSLLFISRLHYHHAGAPKANFRKISVRKAICDLEFSEHLLYNFLFACLS